MNILKSWDAEQAKVSDLLVSFLPAASTTPSWRKEQDRKQRTELVRRRLRSLPRAAALPWAPADALEGFLEELYCKSPRALEQSARRGCAVSSGAFPPALPACIPAGLALAPLVLLRRWGWARLSPELLSNIP